MSFGDAWWRLDPVDTSNYRQRCGRARDAQVRSIQPVDSFSVEHPVVEV